ncbi:hypothetical protein SRB5_46300 [Streptomyces sp. RB5]|uniref:Histidine kinase/HSP90-like ATPase domain-containing protein n=1 Tax=Streptomyces smaragdinus TaxID=2585196 RepID=A0A7K0CMG4_9ACTN|nr:ATP-binding protein [Streptomyces smaragdinus]MQY14463.1 hypothetical protein [Streptomyces smaragdinus]
MPARARDHVIAAEDSTPWDNPDQLQQLRLDSDPASAAVGRRFVRAYVDRHRPGAGEDHLDTVELITSELVTNGIRYGTPDAESLYVVVHVTDEVTRIEVQDAVRCQLRTSPPGSSDDRGRGLIILDGLCVWGVRDLPVGKGVWAMVAVNGRGEEAASERHKIR